MSFSLIIYANQLRHYNKMGDDTLKESIELEISAQARVAAR